MDSPLSEVETITAYHESGHVVMAWLLGGRVHVVTLTPEDRGEGFSERFGETTVSWIRDANDKRQDAVRQIQVALAGPVAEMIYEGNAYEPDLTEKWLTGEWAADMRLAVESARTFIPDANQIRNYLQKMTQSIIDLLGQTQTWAAVAALADELETHETLESSEIESILSVWI